MNESGFIALSWIATFGVTGLYALWVLRRGRRLSQQVEPEDRRWM